MAKINRINNMAEALIGNHNCVNIPHSAVSDGMWTLIAHKTGAGSYTLNTLITEAGIYRIKGFNRGTWIVNRNYTMYGPWFFIGNANSTMLSFDGYMQSISDWYTDVDTNTRNLKNDMLLDNDYYTAYWSGGTLCLSSCKSYTAQIQIIPSNSISYQTKTGWKNIGTLEIYVWRLNTIEN